MNDSIGVLPIGITTYPRKFLNKLSRRKCFFFVVFFSSHIELPQDYARTPLSQLQKPSENFKKNLLLPSLPQILANF